MVPDPSPPPPPLVRASFPRISTRKPEEQGMMFNVPEANTLPAAVVDPHVFHHHPIHRGLVGLALFIRQGSVIALAWMVRM